jgi:hypothetical protein
VANISIWMAQQRTAEISRQRELDYPCAVLVADKPNGPAVIQHLQLNVLGAIEITPRGKPAPMFAAALE